MSRENALNIDTQAVTIPAIGLHAGLLGEEVYIQDSRSRKVIGLLTSIRVFLTGGSEASRDKTMIQLVVGGQSLWLKPDEEVTFLRITDAPQLGVQDLFM